MDDHARGPYIIVIERRENGTPRLALTIIGKNIVLHGQNIWGSFSDPFKGAILNLESEFGNFSFQIPQFGIFHGF
jgi:hypothetical protein